MSGAYMDSSKTLGRTALVAGEVLLPGASELISGKIASGVTHFVLAGLAGAVLAPSMPVLATLAAIGIRVNSYSKATTGVSMVDAMATRISAATSSKPAGTPEL